MKNWHLQVKEQIVHNSSTNFAEDEYHFSSAYYIPGLLKSQKKKLLSSLFREALGSTSLL